MEVWDMNCVSFKTFSLENNTPQIVLNQYQCQGKCESVHLELGLQNLHETPRNYSVRRNHTVPQPWAITQLRIDLNPEFHKMLRIPFPSTPAYKQHVSQWFPCFSIFFLYISPQIEEPFVLLADHSDCNFARFLMLITHQSHQSSQSSMRVPV